MVFPFSGAFRLEVKLRCMLWLKTYVRLCLPHIAPFSLLPPAPGVSYHSLAFWQPINMASPANPSLVESDGRNALIELCCICAIERMILFLYTINIRKKTKKQKILKDFSKKPQLFFLGPLFPLLLGRLLSPLLGLLLGHLGQRVVGEERRVY